MENEVYRKNPKRKKRKTWILLLLLFTVLYFFRQAYLMNANSVDTVKAGEGYINDSIISQGIICRDEIVLTKSSAGVVDYLVQDGERISRGRLLAKVYPSYQDIKNLEYLRNRQQMLEDISSVSGFLDYGTVDMSVTKKQLSAQLSRLASLSEEDGVQSVASELADMTLSLNKISVATGRTDNFSQAKTQLEAEIAAAKSAVNNPTDSLYARRTGYFLQKTDGYEKTATVNNFLGLSYEDGFNIINSSQNRRTDDNEYGKIITDYKWSICTYVDSRLCKDLYIGKSVRISVNLKENEYAKATVENLVDLGEKTLVVVQCSSMNSQATKLRITDCEILFKQYTGIKIPKTALHFDGEQMGVFVNFSNLVQFKKITPVYEDENYVIVPKETGENNEIRLHDSIIVKGRNLYDGKYL